MYTLAKAIDSSVTRDQSSYFPVISYERLGYTEDAQFQLEEQVGYVWLSRRNEDTGEIIVSADSTNTSARNASSAGRNIWHMGNGLWLESNMLSAMPRSYVTKTDGFYNFYAATAESVSFSTPAGTEASDSICPKGWRLPYAGSSTADKSFRNLFINSYGLNESSSAEVRRAPLNYTLVGNISYASGQRYGQRNADLFAASTVQARGYAHRFSLGTTQLDVSSYDSDESGTKIRCVKK